MVSDEEILKEAHDIYDTAMAKARSNPEKPLKTEFECCICGQRNDEPYCGKHHRVEHHLISKPEKPLCRVCGTTKDNHKGKSIPSHLFYPNKPKTKRKTEAKR